MCLKVIATTFENFKRKSAQNIHMFWVDESVRYLKPQGFCLWDVPVCLGDLSHRYTLAVTVVSDISNKPVD